jgi:hypothetical protein
VLAAVRQPSALTLATLGAVVLGIAAVAHLLRRSLRHRSLRSASNSGADASAA